MGHILKRLEPEYHDAFRDTLAAHHRARGRLLEGVPWPRPTYAGRPATAVVDLVLMCTAEHLKTLAGFADGGTKNERLRERSRSSLDERLAQLRALLEDRTLPTILRAEIENALTNFRSTVTQRTGDGTLVARGDRDETEHSWVTMRGTNS